MPILPHQAFTSSAVKFDPLSVMMLWGTPYRCTTPDIKSMTGPDSAVFTGLASIHLVNLSTMTNKYFFLMASPFKRSDHIQPPDHEGPSYGDCLESGRGHMTLIGKELATDAVLDKVLCVCSGRRPIEACTEGLAD